MTDWATSRIYDSDLSCRVDQLGIEPRTSACKADVIPLSPPAPVRPGRTAGIVASSGRGIRLLAPGTRGSRACSSTVEFSIRPPPAGRVHRPGAGLAISRSDSRERRGKRKTAPGPPAGGLCRNRMVPIQRRRRERRDRGSHRAAERRRAARAWRSGCSPRRPFGRGGLSLRIRGRNHRLGSLGCRRIPPNPSSFPSWWPIGLPPSSHFSATPARGAASRRSVSRRCRALSPLPLDNVSDSKTADAATLWRWECQVDGATR